MRKPVLLTVLASLILLVGACANDTVDVTHPPDFAAATAVDLNLEGCWEPTPQWVIDDLEWEEFSGTIQPGMGGFLQGQSATWGRACYFSIQVPPEALPYGNGPTDFSLRIPTKASYAKYQSRNCGKGLPLIMEMTPSGLNFLVPVIVHATYMPWMIEPDMSWEHWSSYPVYGDYELLQVREDWFKGALRKVTLSYEAPHFSRWETGGPLGPPDTEIAPIEMD